MTEVLLLLTVNSGARWQLVTSFNEHGEGSGVESCDEWASPSGFGLYLDALHADGEVLRAATV